MRSIEITPGTSVVNAVHILCASAPARFTFNGIPLRARYATTRPADLLAYWHRKQEERCVQWSPERTARERADALDVQAKQAAVDALIADLLTSVDWTDHSAPIAWLCALSGPADRVGVHFDGPALAAVFAERGYAVGANCGDAFDGESRDIFARYIVGQGLDALSRGWAPHGMIVRFAEEWRAKFDGHEAARVAALAAASTP